MIDGKLLSFWDTMFSFDSFTLVTSIINAFVSPLMSLFIVDVSEWDDDENVTFDEVKFVAREIGSFDINESSMHDFSSSCCWILFRIHLTLFCRTFCIHFTLNVADENDFIHSSDFDFDFVHLVTFFILFTLDESFILSCEYITTCCWFCSTCVSSSSSSVETA